MTGPSQQCLGLGYGLDNQVINLICDTTEPDAIGSHKNYLVYLLPVLHSLEESGSKRVISMVLRGPFCVRDQI